MSNNRMLWSGTDHAGFYWEIIRRGWPRKRYSDARPNWVQFRKFNAEGRLMLDRVAAWDGDHWSGKRWSPRRPVVSDDVRLIVEEILSLGVVV